MINSPPLFATFAASIRHEANDDGSILTYKLHFNAKPRFLSWLLEPLMLKALAGAPSRCNMMAALLLLAAGRQAYGPQIIESTFSTIRFGFGSCSFSTCGE
jgi:hypothetical protein